MKLIKNYKKFVNEAQAIPVEKEAQGPEATNEPTSGGSCKCSSLTGDVELYRLTSHPVVDLSKPGEHYVCDKASVSPELLDKKGEGELYLITVKCNAENIDKECSEQECSSTGCDACVCVKDDAQCEIVSVEPWKNN